MKPLRIVARRAIYHYRKLADLDPDTDDCPGECGEPKGRDGYCAGCPVGELSRDFREACEEEIKETCPPESREWSFDNLYSDVMHALNRDSALSGRGYPENCSALEAACIDTVRWAKNKAERVREWNRKQEPKGGRR